AYAAPRVSTPSTTEGVAAGPGAAVPERALYFASVRAAAGRKAPGSSDAPRAASREGASMDVTTATFEQEVLEASRRLPVVVDFWAPWCGPCRTLGPIIEKVAADYAGRVKLVKVNSDENGEIAAALDVRSIPNVIAFRDGRPVAQFVGAQPESQVRAFFERLLPSEAEQMLARAEQRLADGRIDDAERVLAEI